MKKEGQYVNYCPSIKGLVVEACNCLHKWVAFGPTAQNLPVGMYRLKLEGISTNYTHASNEGVLNAFRSYVFKHVRGKSHLDFGKKSWTYEDMAKTTNFVHDFSYDGTEYIDANGNDVPLQFTIIVLSDACFLFAKATLVELTIS